MLKTVSAGAVALLVCAAAAAQVVPPFTDAVVVTASGIEEPVDDVPAAVTVISRAEIDASGLTLVGDLLRSLPGTVMLRSGYDGGVASLFVRGTSSTHTLVLLDGVRLNSPFFGGYDFSLPMTAGLERVELVRGAYSALYGADALGGVVQLVTAPPKRDGASLSVETGPDGWRRAELGGSVVAGRWAGTVSAASREGSGPLANDDFSSREAMLDLGYTAGEGRRVGVLVRRTAGSTEVPFVGADRTPRRRTTAEETVAAVPVRWRLGARTALEANVSWVARDMGFEDPDDPTGFVSGDTTADSTGARVVLRHAGAVHALSAGAEWRRDRVTDGSNFGFTLHDATQSTRSVFAQDHVALGAGAALIAGVRWDDAQPWGSELSPRLTVSLDRRSFRGWVSWGRAFRAPGLGELYFPFSGNPHLRPERSRNAEAGLAVPVLGGRGRLQVVGFRNRTTDLVEFEYASYAFANVGRAAQDGVELSWLQATGAWGELEAALTWLHTGDGSGAPLLRRPSWSGSAGWRGVVAGRVTGAFTLVWVGRRADVDPVTFARVDDPGFLTADAAVAVPLSAALRLRLRGENLTGRRYEAVRGYPAPGRRLMVGLDARLQ